MTSFTQKLRFLIDIQITIFDKLEERLRGNLEAYLTLTTSLGRAMGGVSKEEQDRLLGIEGLERLCKTYGSADYLERAMRDWSDDVVGYTRPIDSRELTLATVFPRHLGRAARSRAPRREYRRHVGCGRGGTHVKSCRRRR